ncbi:Uncharacterised protein [uncultured archaeon]|nr:Uncharacterised protein [uncultured archaeon]
MSWGSARLSIADSIFSFIVLASPPHSCLMERISTCIALFLMEGSPIIFTIVSDFISGYARSPAFSKAAHWTVPSSSEIVNMVGPPVCFICITSPERCTSLPRYFGSSVVFLRGSCFSTSIAWYSLRLFCSSSMLPLGAMFFTSTKSLSPISGMILILLAWMRPRSCGFRSTNTPKLACPCTLPSYIFPTSSSRLSHSGLRKCTRGFFEQASQSSPLPVTVFPQTVHVRIFPLPAQDLHGSVIDILPVPLQAMHLISPPMSLPRSFSESFSRLMAFGLPEPLQSGHSFSLWMMEPVPLQAVHSIVID